MFSNPVVTRINVMRDVCVCVFEGTLPGSFMSVSPVTGANTKGSSDGNVSGSAAKQEDYTRRTEYRAESSPLQGYGENRRAKAGRKRDTAASRSATSVAHRGPPVRIQHRECANSASVDIMCYVPAVPVLSDVEDPPRPAVAPSPNHSTFLVFLTGTRMTGIFIYRKQAVAPMPAVNRVLTRLAYGKATPYRGDSSPSLSRPRASRMRMRYDRVRCIAGSASEELHPPFIHPFRVYIAPLYISLAFATITSVCDAKKSTTRSVSGRKLPGS